MVRHGIVLGHGCFPLIWVRENLEKSVQGAKLQVSLYRKQKKFTSKSPLRFLGKCAGRNLISGRSLYPFDDAVGQISNCLLIGLLSRLVWGIGEQRIGRAFFLGILPLGPIFSLSLLVSPLSSPFAFVCSC